MTHNLGVKVYINHKRKTKKKKKKSFQWINNISGKPVTKLGRRY